MQAYLYIPTYSHFRARRLILPLVEQCTDAMLNWRNADGDDYTHDPRLLNMFLKRVCECECEWVCECVKPEQQITSIFVNVTHAHTQGVSRRIILSLLHLDSRIDRLV